MDLAQQQELVRGMALELVEAAPSGWTSMNYRYDYIGGVAASENLVTFENGETERKRHPRSVDKKAKFLKGEMYQEGKGAWLAMSISVTRPGKFNAEFHYDKELGVHPISPSPESYVFELGKFPRDDDAISDWLREKIGQAQG
ncbi:antitoxin YezG family protein [Nocardiopsis quinghaiensis]|uniref:immunity protein YezG family protein n=1 Tax=Nocardiopsis quinghaiensis TaxID=464995 RepID=UPI001238B05D|nr:immunity protein YezG family protein [Nocardiopsis quinghaiensis]